MEDQKGLYFTDKKGQLGKISLFVGCFSIPLIYKENFGIREGTVGIFMIQTSLDEKVWEIKVESFLPQIFCRRKIWRE